MKILDKWKQKARLLRLETLAIYLACKHPETPWHAKALAVALVALAVSPLDVIPDFIPVLGYLDDLVLIPLGVALVIRMIPPPVMTECRQKARQQVETKPGPGRAGAWAIIVFWLVCAGVSAWWAWRFFSG